MNAYDSISVVRTDSLKGRRGRLPSKSKNTEDFSTVGALSLTKALVQAFTAGNEKTPDHSPVHTGGSYDQLTDSINASLGNVHRWAEKIPGWAKLTVLDRSTLLQNRIVNVLSLRLAYL